MNAALFALVLTAFSAADEPMDTKPMRKANPFAPSLPQLTADEEDKLDDIINRFMQADIGGFKGEDAAKARKEFEDLKPEAIPALIRGLNRAAKLEHSCPTVMIAAKLNKLLMVSDDLKLLDFARDEIGASAERSKHAAVLAQLKANVGVRKSMVARAAPAAGEKSLRTMPTEELIATVSSIQGDKLRPLLLELEQRKGNEVLTALSVAATSSDNDIKQLARQMLDRNLGRQTMDVVKAALKDSNDEIRMAAARVVGEKWPGLFSATIELLDDGVGEVREAAHKSLMRLSRGLDFGPEKDAKPEDRVKAQEKWRDWLAKQKR